MLELAKLSSAFDGKNSGIHYPNLEKISFELAEFLVLPLLPKSLGCFINRLSVYKLISFSFSYSV